jgi:hypothetical protein
MATFADRNFHDRISFENLSRIDFLALCPSCRHRSDARAIARTMDLAKRNCVEHAERTKRATGWLSLIEEAAWDRIVSRGRGITRCRDIITPRLLRFGLL